MPLKKSGGITMKKIGMMVATVREMEAAIKKYGKAKKVEEHGMIKVWTYEMPGYILYVCNSGWGEIPAGGATQLLISLYKVDAVFNYGVVGALTEEIAIKDPCIVTSVVHYDFDVSPLEEVKQCQYEYLDDIYIRTDMKLRERALDIHPDLRPVICASADKFVDSAEDKKSLHERFNADICDMEAAGIVLTCVRNKIPCLLIKSVSDSVTGGEKEFNAMVREASVECMEIVNKIVEKI